MVQAPVPFYILCGSLGAGKTTLLMRLLEHWKSQGKRAGVLMNEAGEISIDGPRVGTIAEQVMNLAGGCVCCDTKEDLSWGLAQLVRDYESELIVLECSGLADPVEVIKQFVPNALQMELCYLLDDAIPVGNPPRYYADVEEPVTCAERARPGVPLPC